MNQINLFRTSLVISFMRYELKFIRIELFDKATQYIGMIPKL